MLLKGVQILDAISNLTLEEKTSEDQGPMMSMAEKWKKNQNMHFFDIEEVEVTSSKYMKTAFKSQTVWLMNIRLIVSTINYSEIPNSSTSSQGRHDVKWAHVKFNCMFEVLYVAPERRKGISTWVVASRLLSSITATGVVEKHITIEFYNGYKH